MTLSQLTEFSAQGSPLTRYVSLLRAVRACHAADLAAIGAVRLRRSDSLMKGVFESSLDGIMIVRADYSIERTNDAATELFGYAPRDLCDRTLLDLIPGVASGLSHDAQTLEGIVGYSESSGVRADGKRFPLEFAVRNIELDESTLHLVIVRDITDRVRQQKQLEHQALHDALTELPNRVLLMDRLKQAIDVARRDGKPLALLLLDLDRFKEVNDTLGHQVGDVLLREVAQRLPSKLRKTDTVARIGGDEFALLLPAVTDLERARRVSSRILEDFREPFTYNGLAVDIGVSIGIAMSPEHAQQEDELLKCADVAMYAAKRGHTSVALYDQRDDRNTIRHLTLTGELRRAIEDRHISLEYQPKLELSTRRVRGVEALARWKHPVLGRVSPGEFIPQAELTGLIQPLTMLTLDMALGRLAHWYGEGFDLRVAVNLSARVLHDNTLPDLLSGSLSKWKVDPSHVTFEITESAIMIDPEKSLRVAGTLAEMGSRLSIDDFGTGYSSLSYLSRLPASELKVDRSFVSRMMTSPQDATIVQSTIDLAHNLGLEVVAEGIEDQLILDQLHKMGCDLGQGYFIGAPMAPADLEGFLHQSLQVP